MSKYDPLRESFERMLNNRIKMTFEDIEDDDKIGVSLPKAAREHREWWANETSPNTRHSQCRAWLSAGWKVEEVNLSEEFVVFVRIRS